MASVQEAIDAARWGNEPLGPPEEVADALTIEELGNLLAMRGQRAYFMGYEAGRAEERGKSFAAFERAEEEHRRAREIREQELAQRLTLEHLSLSAPLAGAIQKARKIQARPTRTDQQRRERAAQVSDALAAVADAYAKFTSEMGK